VTQSVGGFRSPFFRYWPWYLYFSWRMETWHRDAGWRIMALYSFSIPVVSCRIS